MAGSLNDLAYAPGPDTYYSDGFHTVLEDHMTYLRGLSSTSKIAIDPIDVIRYKADFFALLLKLNVKPQLHWVTMRMSGLVSPAFVPEDLVNILIPDESEITRLYQSLTAVNNIAR